MKEKIIKILKKKAECSMNMHADFDNVDETQFETIADEIVKLYNLQSIMKSVCPECNKPHKTDNNTTEQICLNCGNGWKTVL